MKRKRKPTERTAVHAERVVTETAPKPANVMFLEQFRVASFATDHGNLDEVHVLFETRDAWKLEIAFCMRFKSPEAMAVFIEELIAYRRYVWPEADDPNFDAEALPPTRVSTHEEEPSS